MDIPIFLFSYPTKHYQVGPNDHLLREAEYSEPAALEGVVEHVSGVSHHLVPLKYSTRDEIVTFI